MEATLIPDRTSLHILILSSFNSIIRIWNRRGLVMNQRPKIKNEYLPSLDLLGHDDIERDEGEHDEHSHECCPTELLVQHEQCKRDLNNDTDQFIHSNPLLNCSSWYYILYFLHPFIQKLQNTNSDQQLRGNKVNLQPGRDCSSTFAVGARASWICKDQCSEIKDHSYLSTSMAIRFTISPAVFSRRACEDSLRVCNDDDSDIYFMGQLHLQLYLFLLVRKQNI